MGPEGFDKRTEAGEDAGHESVAEKVVSESHCCGCPQCCCCRASRRIVSLIGRSLAVEKGDRHFAAALKRREIHSVAQSQSPFFNGLNPRAIEVSPPGEVW